MKEKLFRVYVKFIRPFIEKGLNDRFGVHNPIDTWGTIKNLSLYDFSKVINVYGYKMDRLGGLIDHAFNFDNPNSFFATTEKNRDCDQWARIWAVWAIHNGYEFQEYIITTREHLIKDSHVVCTILIKGKWYLCDYTPYGKYNTKEQAVEDVVEHWNKYTKHNLVYEAYQGRQ